MPLSPKQARRMAAKRRRRARRDASKHEAMPAILASLVQAKVVKVASSWSYSSGLPKLDSISLVKSTITSVKVKWLYGVPILY